MRKALLCSCVVLVAAMMMMMTSARPSLDNEDEQRLEKLLERLLNEKRHVCDDKDCNTGRCGGGENPHGWDEAWYCWDCNGPNNDQTNGGLTCELPDPCHQNDRGTNPCASEPVKTRCRTSSMKEIGYYCTTPPSSRRSALDDLLVHLDNDAGEGEYHEIRMMMARSQDPVEGLVKYVRSSLE